MKLTKQGLYRNRGEKIVFYEDHIKLSVHKNGMEIYTSGQEMSESGRQTSETTHFFKLELTYEDIASIIGTLEIRDEKSGKLNRSLRSALLDKKEILLQLLMLTSNFLD